MCDLPATRKVCGYTNFNGKKGCSKCMKEFPSTGDKIDYSRFDCDTWTSRNSEDQRIIGNEFKNSKTLSACNEIRKQYGVKHSVLLELPYFDIVRYHVIDPMHNIFLGIAKHTMKTWKDLKIIGTKEYAVMQDCVDSINPPPKIGHIPRKIVSGFAAITADEWKHWILIYSLYALHGILPTADYKCWCLLVQSCRLLSLPVISKDQIETAHALLVKFCTMLSIAP